MPGAELYEPPRGKGWGEPSGGGPGRVPAGGSGGGPGTLGYCCGLGCAYLVGGG